MKRTFLFVGKEKYYRVVTNGNKYRIEVEIINHFLWWDWKKTQYLCRYDGFDGSFLGIVEFDTEEQAQECIQAIRWTTPYADMISRIFGSK